jgi:SAM-dependent methyltransferase
MNDGWQVSAGAWITEQGEHGDFARRYVLDRVMLARALVRSPRTAFDLGCGEGRFCRVLRRHGIDVVGLDPTPALVAAAQARDRVGRFCRGTAESLPFRDQTFDLVVSYLTLIDILDIRAAIPEMVRVLRPGGSLLIANLNGFVTACGDVGWVKDAAGRRLHYPVDGYLDERAMWIAYRGIRVVNHHRPFSAYVRALLSAGLRLDYFDEPAPSPDAPAREAANYRRAPWFHVMEWSRP